MTAQLPSKVRLAQIASFSKSMALPPSHEEIEAMSRALLAAHEQEPVYQVFDEAGGWFDIEKCDVSRETADGNQVRTLYTHPAPAPVALTSGYSDFEEIWSSSTHPLTQDDEMKDFAWDIWNACRAAMLNHPEQHLDMVDHSGDVNKKVAPPIQSGNSGQHVTVPDGYVLVPVEPTEDMVINGFESEPDEHFSDSSAWEAYNAMSGCQQAAHRATLCWAAMIAAAPKGV